MVFELDIPIYNDHSERLDAISVFGQYLDSLESFVQGGDDKIWNYYQR